MRNRRTTAVRFLAGAVTICSAGVGVAHGQSQTLTFQQGAGPYTGTEDTWINEDSPDSSYGGDSTKWVDDDTANSIWSDYYGQALLRFDGIVGENNPAAIPPGSQVISAVLRIHVVEDNDSPFWTPTVYVHRVVRDWNEGSTWNSLGGGLSVPADIQGAFSTFSSDNEPEDNTLKQVSLVEQVQAWVNGEPNWGVAFLFEVIDGNDDGIEIASSENGNGSVRPQLEVTFVPPPPPPPPNLADRDGNGVVNGFDLAYVLGTYGTSSALGDVNLDGIVDGHDLASLISAWTM